LQTSSLVEHLRCVGLGDVCIDKRNIRIQAANQFQALANPSERKPHQIEESVRRNLLDVCAHQGVIVSDNE